MAQEELHKSMMVGDYSRAKQMRALMVVLPYSASIKDDGNSMQELYAKAPITRMVESEINQAPVITPVTQKPATNTLDFITTTRRSTTSFPIFDDFITTSFKPLPKYDKMMFSQSKDEAKLPIKTDLEGILREMKIEISNLPTATPRNDQSGVAPDVKDVLQNLGLWEANESPSVFSKQTLSENFAPIELDFKTGTVRTVEKSTESINKRMQAPQISPTDFVSFKPIPKAEKSEVEFENYEYFKSLGLLDSPKNSRSHIKSPGETNKPVVSKKAQGFTRRKSDVSYETDILKKISKQEREQLLDVLKKLETQVVAGKMGPNPVDNPEINLTKKDVKRQEESTESVAPIKFSFNFETDSKNDKEEVSAAPEVLSEDLPLISTENEGRIVNKPNITSEDITETSTTSTTTTEPPLNTSSDIDTFSLPPLNPVGDDFKLDNLEDSGGLDPVADAMPPPEKKNGFYFLADWNSFLEVGEGKDRVEVRFTPRVGDSRLFIPVTVP